MPMTMVLRGCRPSSVGNQLISIVPESAVPRSVKGSEAYSRSWNLSKWEKVQKNLGHLSESLFRLPRLAPLFH